MLLPGARILQGSPPCVFAILLYTPQAEQKRTVTNFFRDHPIDLPTKSWLRSSKRFEVKESRFYMQPVEAWQSPEQVPLFCQANPH